jgi:hypothetical protein
MKVKLNLITEKAKQNKRLKFTSLIHHINEENLMRCYQDLKRDSACGIDNVTVEEYGRNLARNIRDLLERLKTKQYRKSNLRSKSDASTDYYYLPQAHNTLLRVSLTEKQVAIDYLKSHMPAEI